jgi:hypothetical protein
VLGVGGSNPLTQIIFFKKAVFLRKEIPFQDCGKFCHKLSGLIVDKLKIVENLSFHDHGLYNL